MSLHHIAKQIAAKGRDEDTMLVHMTPREVAGLQQIALAAGGSLTVNPDTGLPEAGFLKSLLPMIAGGIATMFTGPLGAALVGGATGALTGDKDQSLLMRAGLGALGGFGGAGIAQGLGAAGASAAGNTAATQLGNVGADLAKNAVGGVSEFVPTLTKIGGTAVDTLRASGLGSEAAKLMGQNALAGVGNIMSSGATGQAARTAFMNAVPLGKFGLAAAAAPTMAEAMKTPTLDVQEPKDAEYYDVQYNAPTVNPNFGQPGETYFTGASYGPTKKYSSYEEFLKQTGGMAEGGDVSPQRAAVNDYISSLNTKLTALPAPRPAPTPAPAAIAPDVNAPPNMAGGMQYDPVTQRYSGADRMNTTNFPSYGGLFGPAIEELRRKIEAANMPQRMAEGGLASLGGYSDGGRLLRGPGDGVSDDIPAMIHRDDGTKQEARLADGEFVLPARIVSEIGNGSTEAGAKKLYAMMDRIQQGRGKTLKDVAANTKAEKHLPA
jgi:hypothetical protein